MNKWKLIYTVEFLTIKNNFNIGDVFFENQGDETLAIIEVESSSQEDAKRNGDLLLRMTINAMATIIKQNMNITIKDISQINSEVITVKSKTHLSVDPTVVMDFNHPLPKEPMPIENAKKLIDDIFSKWIKHKKQIKSKELT